MALPGQSILVPICLKHLLAQGHRFGDVSQYMRSAGGFDTGAGVRQECKEGKSRIGNFQSWLSSFLLLSAQLVSPKGRCVFPELWECCFFSCLAFPISTSL